MLSTLSDKSSVWIFQANKILNTYQIEKIQESLAVFVPEWAAHGVNLKADFEVAKALFIIVGVDESHAEASGCSKDALTRQIKFIGEQIGVDFFDRLTIAYITDKNKIELADMLSFKNLIQKDIVRQNTIVFNNLITTKAELMENWEVKLSDSWHANLMPII